MQVTILPDDVYESTEHFYGRLNNPSFGEIKMGGDQAMVFIEDATSKSDVTACSPHVDVTCMAWQQVPPKVPPTFTCPIHKLVCGQAQP